MTKTKALKKPYGAYLRRRATPDLELTQVGRDTPGGEYLRRFWQPIALSSELKDLPIALQIMGEELVLFRDLGGRIGLLERHCCHRGASLEFGRIRERGIQCCYHGWHFDVDGKLLDTPVDPNAPFAGRLYQGAYPVVERQGLIFTYMGDPDGMPEFPNFDFLEETPAIRFYYKRYSPCNWVQVRDNEVDLTHASFLHTVMAGPQLSNAYNELPIMDWRPTPIGMIGTQTRRWKENIFVHVNEMVMPNIARIAAVEDGEGETIFDRRGAIINWCVPIDDTNSFVIGWNTIEKDLPHPTRDAFMDREARTGRDLLSHPQLNFTFGQDGNRSYEERQRLPGDWEVWVSQGPVNVHGNEHLTVNDGSVVLYRRMVREGIDAVRSGKDPKGVVRGANAVIRTYANNTIKTVPVALTREDDLKLCRDFANAVLEKTLSGELLANPDAPIL